MNGNKPSQTNPVHSCDDMSKEQMINYLNLIAFNHPNHPTTPTHRSRPTTFKNTTRLHGRRTRPGMLKQPRNRGMMH